MYFMSVVPILHTYEGNQRLLDRNISSPMTADDVLITAYNPMLSRDYYRPWRVSADQNCNQVGSTVRMDKNKFQINLDVQHFAPEEIDVRTVDGFVVIEGKHKEKKDEHGFITRYFSRRYMLPDGANPELVECKLSSDGVLSIIAPKYTPEAQAERAVPIAQTGPIRKEAKAPPPPGPDDPEK